MQHEFCLSETVEQSWHGRWDSAAQCAVTLVSLSNAPTAIAAAANCYCQMLVSQSDNNVKLIVLDRLQVWQPRCGCACRAPACCVQTPAAAIPLHVSSSFEHRAILYAEQNVRASGPGCFFGG